MRSTIESDVSKNKVFVYMKGVPAAPMCGFSMTVCRWGFTHFSGDAPPMAPSSLPFVLHMLTLADASARLENTHARAHAHRILDYYGAEYGSRNVLEDEDIRQGIKDFTSWPTIPQVFIDGEFVGGCDIMINMHEEGELAAALGVEGKGK